MYLFRVGPVCCVFFLQGSGKTAQGKNSGGKGAAKGGGGKNSYRPDTQQGTKRPAESSGGGDPFVYGALHLCV